MLVLNLACERGHGFEGWFGSATDFESQQQRGLLSCPLCNSSQVRRMPSAPRLNLSSASEPATASVGRAPKTQEVERSQESAGPGRSGSGGGSRGGEMASPSDAPAAVTDLQRQVMQAVRQIIASTEDVGERFAEEARRIHYGESEARGIRGQATPDETQALAEEGIEVLALGIPDALKGPLQ